MKLLRTLKSREIFPSHFRAGWRKWGQHALAAQPSNRSPCKCASGLRLHFVRWPATQVKFSFFFSEMNPYSQTRKASSISDLNRNKLLLSISHCHRMSAHNNFPDCPILQLECTYSVWYNSMFAVICRAWQHERPRYHSDISELFCQLSAINFKPVPKSCKEKSFRRCCAQVGQLTNSLPTNLRLDSDTDMNGRKAQQRYHIWIRFIVLCQESGDHAHQNLVHEYIAGEITWTGNEMGIGRTRLSAVGRGRWLKCFVCCVFVGSHPSDWSLFCLQFDRWANAFFFQANWPHSLSWHRRGKQISWTQRLGCWFSPALFS